MHCIVESGFVSRASSFSLPTCSADRRALASLTAFSSTVRRLLTWSSVRLSSCFHARRLSGLSGLCCVAHMRLQCSVIEVLLSSDPPGVAATPSPLCWARSEIPPVSTNAAVTVRIVVFIPWLGSRIESTRTSVAGFSDLANCLAIVALRIVKAAQRGPLLAPSRHSLYSASNRLILKSCLVAPSLCLPFPRPPFYLGRRLLVPHCLDKLYPPRWRIRSSPRGGQKSCQTPKATRAPPGIRRLDCRNVVESRPSSRRAASRCCQTGCAR
jgi:hypothetical protein